MVDKENKRFLTVFFKEELGEIKKKVKVVEQPSRRLAIASLTSNEIIPNKFVKDMFGLNQEEGIKSIRDLEDFEDIGIYYEEFANSNTPI